MNATAAEDISTTATVGHFINGEYIEDNGRTQPVTNPATGAVTKQVAMATRNTVEDAIAAAEAAFPAWRNTPPAKRAKIMFKFKHLLEEHADEVVALLTNEHGKVLDDAMGEFCVAWKSSITLVALPNCSKVSTHAMSARTSTAGLNSSRSGL